MQWFKHDTSASLDSKLRKVIMKYGTDGYAIYWHCLELIAGSVSENNVTFELEHDSEIIADTLKVKSEQAGQSSVDRVQEIMRYMVSIGLFEESGGRITCFKLLKRLDSSMTSNSKMRAIIQDAKKSHDTIMIPSCFSHDTVMLEENRIDENRTEENRKEEQDKPEKHKHGEHQNVLLTDDEYSRLIKDYHAVAKMAIDYLSAYKVEKGYKSKSDNLTIRRWVIDAVRKKEGLPPLEKTATKKAVIHCTCGGEINKMGFCKSCGVEYAV